VVQLIALSAQFYYIHRNRNITGCFDDFTMALLFLFMAYPTYLYQHISEMKCPLKIGYSVTVTGKLF
jgi:hypothetical protein